MNLVNDTCVRFKGRNEGGKPCVVLKAERKANALTGFRGEAGGKYSGFRDLSSQY